MVGWGGEGTKKDRRAEGVLESVASPASLICPLPLPSTWPRALAGEALSQPRAPSGRGSWSLSPEGDFEGDFQPGNSFQRRH